MSWSTLSISAPASDAINSIASLDKHSVSPWQQGEGFGINAHLSFPNAVECLGNKVENQSPALAIAITAANFADFASQCALLITPFPMPILKQWYRRATELAALEKTKLDLVAEQASSKSTLINAIPVVKAVQVADLRQKAFDDAESFKSSDPIANLANFQAEKTAHDTEVAGLQAAADASLTGGAGWRFYATTDIKNALSNNAPGSEYTITAIVLFQGSAADLSLLTEIMQ